MAQITIQQDILQGQLLASQGSDVAALQVFSQVLKSDPTQPQALAYQGWLLFQAGRKDHSRALITQGMEIEIEATTIAPQYAVGHLFMGLMDVQQRHLPKEAVGEFEKMFADKIAPSLLQQVKSEVRTAYQLANVTPPSALS
jgi:tetratricopeptide (TPR) repeat protein